MKNIFHVTCFVSLIFGGATISAFGQNPFSPWLSRQGLTAVPLLDQQLVVPGAVEIVGTYSYFNKPTDSAKQLEITKTTPEVAEQHSSTASEKSFLGKVLVGAGFSSGTMSTYEIDEATLVCDSVDESDGGPLDDLVYTDPAFKKSIRSTLGPNGSGSPLLISKVCWATYFKMSETSSRAIAGALNTSLPACTATPTGQETTANQPTHSGTSTSDTPAKTQTVSQIVAKPTVADLMKSLKEAASNLAVDATLAGKFCTQSGNSVVLKAKTPVAIALKTWEVYACGPGTSFACKNPPADDPNFLEYRQVSYPNLH